MRRTITVPIIAATSTLAVTSPALAWDHYRTNTSKGPVVVTVQVTSKSARFLIYQPNSDVGHCFAGRHVPGTPSGYYTGYNYRPNSAHGRSLGRADYWIQKRSDGTLRLANKYAPFDWVMQPSGGVPYPKRYCPPKSWTR